MLYVNDNLIVGLEPKSCQLLETIDDFYKAGALIVKNKGTLILAAPDTGDDSGGEEEAKEGHYDINIPKSGDHLNVYDGISIEWRKAFLREKKPILRIKI